MRIKQFTNLFELSEHLGVQFTDVQSLIDRNKISVFEQRGYLILSSDLMTEEDQNDESGFDDQMTRQLVIERLEIELSFSDEDYTL